MTPHSISLVLLGESFPIGAFDMSSFTFRHRAFKETLRLPVAIQAESRGVQLQLMPDRFAITVTEVDDIDVQVRGIGEMLETFFDYVGRRAITAVGHNAVFVLNQREDALGRLSSTLFKGPDLERALGSEVQLSASIFLFKTGKADRNQVSIGVNDQKQTVAEFNAHFDVRGVAGRLDTALDSAGESFESFCALAERFNASFLAEGVAAIE